jgi:hypothetical protein
LWINRSVFRDSQQESTGAHRVSYGGNPGIRPSGENHGFRKGGRRASGSEWIWLQCHRWHNAGRARHGEQKFRAQKPGLSPAGAKTDPEKSGWKWRTTDDSAPLRSASSGPRGANMPNRILVTGASGFLGSAIGAIAGAIVGAIVGISDRS